MNALLEHAYTRSTARMQWVVEQLLRKVDPGCGRAWFEPQEFSWTRELESGWREIRAELEQVLSAEQRIPTFQEVSREQLPISSDPLWRTYFLAVMGERIEDHCRQCPQTAALLAKVPDLGNAMFSILLPGKRIPLHTGLYKGLLRYHLALRVPASETQCWIEVNGERRLWHGKKVDRSFLTIPGPTRWPMKPMKSVWSCSWILRDPCHASWPASTAQ